MGTNHQVPELKQGGHGDHWGCIFRDVEEDALLDLIRHVVERDHTPGNFVGGHVYHLHGEHLRVCVLVSQNRLVSAYPEALRGNLWPITISAIVPWANGLEGQLTGECNGATISFFDTHFYENNHKYTLGYTYSFQLAALAYTLGPAIEKEAMLDDGSGAKLSFRGACAYMPAGTGSEGADIDDLWFHSPLGGKITSAEIAGKSLQVYPITIAIPGGFEMNLNLYAAGHAIAPSLADRQPGDDLEGFLWLQGYLADGD